MRSPDPWGAPGTSPEPPGPRTLLLECSPATRSFARAHCPLEVAAGVSKSLPPCATSARRWGRILRGSGLRARGSRRLALCALLGLGCSPRGLAAISVPSPSCSERRGGGAGSEMWPHLGPAAALGSVRTTLPFPAGSDSPLPLSPSRGHLPWLVNCPRSLVTARVGSSKFSVYLNGMAHTRHV